MKRLVLAVAVAMAGCGGSSWPCGYEPTPAEELASLAAGRWDVYGDVPAAFRAEVQAAADVIRQQQGVPPERWGGSVVICSSVEELGAYGLARGRHRVWVVYDGSTATILWPGTSIPWPGTTALEHELCHAAGNEEEAAAGNCVQDAMLEIIHRTHCSATNEIASKA